MRKILLSSSQVSLAISSLIIISFTTLLFLAGYILQQQSLSRLQATLRPLQPSPRAGSVSGPPKPNVRTKLSRPLLDKITWHPPKEFNWSRVAHAQLARDTEELCHALIVLHELFIAKSAAPRLLVFPAVWVNDAENGEINERKDKILQLLKKASRSYRAILVPIEPVVKGGDEMDPRSYSLTSIFSLTNYDRIMVLPMPGLILNSKPLDSMLAYLEPNTIQSFPFESNSSIHLIHPSAETFSGLSTTLPSAEPLLSLEDPDFKPHLYSTLHTIRTSPNFNATEFSETTAFLKLDDDDFPGPQYDLPYHKVVAMRPKDEDQSFLWEKVQSTYKDRRYRVCGLDLLPFSEKSDVKQELK